VNIAACGVSAARLGGPRNLGLAELRYQQHRAQQKKMRDFHGVPFD